MANSKKNPQQDALPNGMAGLVRMAMDQNQAPQPAQGPAVEQQPETEAYVPAAAMQSENVHRPVNYEQRMMANTAGSNMEEFLALVEKYKNKKSNTSNIYIDDDVYNSLDSLKALGGKRKLPKAAIISAIIEKFIRDNLETIRKAVAENSLLPF